MKKAKGHLQHSLPRAERYKLRYLRITKKTMKRVIIAVGCVIVMFSALMFTPNSFSTEKEEVVLEEIIKEVSPDWATDEEAVKAAQDVIHRKELEAELSSLEESFASSTAIYEEEREAYNQRKTEIEKEVGSY